MGTELHLVIVIDVTTPCSLHGVAQVLDAKYPRSGQQSVGAVCALGGTLERSRVVSAARGDDIGKNLQAEAAATRKIFFFLARGT
jgi:hypothetical protein